MSITVESKNGITAFTVITWGVLPGTERGPIVDAAANKFCSFLSENNQILYKFFYSLF